MRRLRARAGPCQPDRPGRGRRAALLLPAVLLAAASLAAWPPPAGAAGQTELIWRRNPDPSALLPAREGRPLLLYFTASWCGPCRLLESEVFAHPAGRDELRHYDLVRLDLESGAGRALADSLGVQSVPTFVMLDSGGRQIERICGYRSRRLLLRDLARFRAGADTITDLQQRLAARPQDLSLRLELGLRHHARHELPAAGELLATGLAELAAPASSAVRPAVGDSLAAEAIRALADIYRRQGEAARGAAVLEHLLAERPDHPLPRVTWQQLARCRRESGQATAAVEALRQAAAIVPPRVEALNEFAAAAADLGWELAAAETAARQAVALTERADPRSMALLADLLRQRRCYPEALLWIKRAVAAAPDDLQWQERQLAILRAAIAGN